MLSMTKTYAWRHWLVGILAFLGLEGAWAMNTEEFKLENGLKVVVREDHRAPIVVAQIWYKVGSAQEHRGVTGIAHALEHMMFQGTQKWPGEGISELISENGGRDNAFTSYDFTAYYAELEASKLPLFFEIEADRMVNLELSQEAFTNEIQVVMEERRLRTDDRPRALTYERFMATAHPAGPYHHPVVGWMDDLEHMRIEDLRAWYQQWYRPENAVIVVVGDVVPKDVYALAQAHFSGITSKPLPAVKEKRELEPLGQKYLEVHQPAQLPYLMMGFLTPSLGEYDQDWEPYALMVAATALDSGLSSRFNEDLVRHRKIAAYAGADYDAFRSSATQFLLSGIPSQDHNVADLQRAFDHHIQKLQQEEIAPQEWERLQAQLMASEIFDKDSMSAQATMLGVWESIGLTWQDADRYIEKLQHVTPLQVKQVANKYFTLERKTVAHLIPTPPESSEKEQENR